MKHHHPNNDEVLIEAKNMLKDVQYHLYDACENCEPILCDYLEEDFQL